MSNRIVPIALIVAIIVCPFLCRNGRCHGCCAAKKSVESICPASEMGSGCCRKSSSDDEGQRPCDDASGASRCQGVCGGAVLEKPNSLSAPTEMRYRYEFNAHPSPPASLLVNRQADTVVRWFDGSMTPGRYIRTLYMSFLC
jgi:hypothetical protein